MSAAPVTSGEDRGHLVYGFPCACGDCAGCPECLARRNCVAHARHLLAYTAHTIHLRCQSCGGEWWADSRRKPSQTDKAPGA